MDEYMTAYQKMVELFETDEGTADRLNRCISDPRVYYGEHTERYAERSIFSDADEDTIIWIGMVDILIEQGIMFEFDHAAELEDFIYGMQKINGSHALAIAEDRFDEDGDITEWLEALYQEWSGQGYVIAGLDIDSDSYCVMIVRGSVFDSLVAEAGKTGHRIALAQEL